MSTYYSKNGSVKQKEKISDRIKDLEKLSTYYEAKEEIEGDLTTQDKKNKYKVEKRLKKLKRTAKILVTTAVLSATLVAGSIGYAAHDIYANNQHTNNIVSGYTIIDINNNRYDTVNAQEKVEYSQYKEDIYKYIELSNRKDNLSKEEKRELNELKESISNNYQFMDELSLEILKTKIANVIGVEDVNRIKLHDKSTQVAADRYNFASGTKTNVYISIDGEIIAGHNSFASFSNGEKDIKRDDLPRGLEECIIAIGKSQANPQENSKEALKKVLNLQEKDLAPLMTKYKEMQKENNNKKNVAEPGR